MPLFAVSLRPPVWYECIDRYGDRYRCTSYTEVHSATNRYMRRTCQGLERTLLMSLLVKTSRVKGKLKLKNISNKLSNDPVGLGLIERNSMSGRMRRGLIRTDRKFKLSEW